MENFLQWLIEVITSIAHIKVLSEDRDAIMAHIWSRLELHLSEWRKIFKVM